MGIAETEEDRRLSTVLVGSPSGAKVTAVMVVAWLALPFLVAVRHVHSSHSLSWLLLGFLYLTRKTYAICLCFLVVAGATTHLTQLLQLQAVSSDLSVASHVG